MAGHDVRNDPQPTNKLKPPSAPTIANMRSAIAASGVASSYSTAQLERSTYNDLVYICRLHNIAVAGL